MKALLLLLAVLSSAVAHAGEYLLTPTSVTSPAGDTFEHASPLAWAMFEADAGSTATLSPGAYVPWDGFGHKNDPFRLLEVRGAGDAPSAVRLLRQSTDTISFANPDLHSNLTLRNLTIEGSSRSAVMYLSNPQIHLGVDGPFRNHRFVDVVIEGGWNHGTGEGVETKWGILGNKTAAWSFIGGAVRGIRWEHAFYFHQTLGDHLIDGTTIENVGRTFVQVANRPTENGGAFGFGLFTIRNVVARGAGLADGGSGFTFSGHAGTVWISNTVVEASPLGLPSGGALVVWPEKGNSNRRNGVLVVEGCRFNVSPCKAPLVQISAVDLLVMTRNRLSVWPHPIALAVNPIGPGFAGMGAEEFPALDAFPRPFSTWRTENDLIQGAVLYGSDVLELEGD